MRTTNKLMETQANDALCQNLKELLTKDRIIAMNEDVLLCRKAFTDGAIHVTVPERCWRTLLYHGHYLTFAGHSGRRKVYDVLRRTYHWPDVASDVHEFVFKYEFCRRHRPLQKHQPWWQLFLPCRPLEFVAIVILEPLIKSKQINRFIIVATECYSKLTRALPVPKTTATHVATVVLENYTMPYGIPITIATDNSSQFVSKFFATPCASIKTKWVTTTEYHPQANGQV